MAKDKSEKKEKKEKRVSLAASDVDMTDIKVERKEKKEKKSKRDSAAAELGDEGASSKKSKKDKKRKSDANESAAKAKAEDSETEEDVTTLTVVEDEPKSTSKAVIKKIVVGAPCPFAHPLVEEEKTKKKIIKSIGKAAKHRALKRGVKEVVKALRKLPANNKGPSSAVIVLAADISPYDVISHIPVLCEDHSVPYCYVPSRIELGAAGATKRPTSVVMISSQAGKRKEGEAEAGDDWAEGYADAHKVVKKLCDAVKV